MHYSEPEEVANSTTGEATGSPTTMFPALCGPSNAVLTEKVNTAIDHWGRVEADKATPTEASPIIVRTSRARDQLSRVQQGEASPGMGPRETQVRTPEDHSLSYRPVTPATPRNRGTVGH